MLLQELIKYKGNQVAPVELESVISELAGVKDIGVIGVPKGDGNELPRAYAVRESSTALVKSKSQIISSHD